MKRSITLKVRKRMLTLLLAAAIFPLDKPCLAQLSSGASVFPNPATGPTVTVAYFMTQPGTARIRVYNLWGYLVASRDDSETSGSQHSYLDISSLATGRYFFELILDYGGAGQTVLHPAILDVKK